MSESSAESGHNARLSPFAFASDTSLRFILLMAFVIAADIRRWYGIAFEAFELGPKLRQCLHGVTPLGVGLLDRATNSVIQTCQRSLLLYEVPAIGLGLLLLAAVTGTIYWLFPRWQIWRLRLSPISPNEVPELYATLQGLCDTAGLRQSPEFWWNPLDGRHLALAFGRTGSYRVALTGSVATLCYTNQASFRSMLLHELAHIRNGDIDTTYLTLAIWWGYLAAALLPYLVIAAASSSTIQWGSADVAIVGVEAALVAGVVLLTRNAVLRARELYADARSLGWHRNAAALNQILDGLRPIKGVRRLVSPHPDPARRRRLLQDTDEMFRFGFWDAFGAGAASSATAITLGMLAAMALIATNFESTNAAFALLVVPLGTVILSAGAAFVATWRSALLTLMRGRHSGSTVRTAFGLVMGVVLCGPALLGAVIFEAATGGPGAEWVEQVPGSQSLLLMDAAGFVAALIIVGAAALLPFLKWVEASATTWLAVALTRSSPRAPFVFGVVGSCLLALAWFFLALLVVGGTWYALHLKGRSGPFSAFWFGVASSKIFPINVIAWMNLVTVWVVPLAARLCWRSDQKDTCAGWAFLDTVGTVPLPALPLWVRRALLIGATGGLLGGIVLPWLHVPLSPGILHEANYPETAFAVELLSMTLTCMLAQGMIASITVLAVPRLGIVHSVFAAFVASWVLTTGEILHLLTRGTTLTISTLLDLILAPVVFGGAVLALTCALVTWILALLVRTLVTWLPSCLRCRWLCCKG